MSSSLSLAASKPLSVSVNLGRAAIFMTKSLNEAAHELSIAMKDEGYTDHRLAGNYTITVRITNFLNQVSSTAIHVELIPFN